VSRQSAEPALGFGRRLQRRGIAGLRNVGSCSIPTASTNHFEESGSYRQLGSNIGPQQVNTLRTGLRSATMRTSLGKSSGKLPNQLQKSCGQMRPHLRAIPNGFSSSRGGGGGSRTPISVYTLKCVANYEKHGVSFEEAATVFSDPEGLDWEDIDHSLSERR